MRVGAKHRALSLVSAATRVGGQIFSIVVIARFIPPAEFGLFSFYLAASGIVALVGDFGTLTAALPALSVAEGRIDMVFKDALTFRAITLTAASVIGGACYLAVARVADTGLFLTCCAASYLANMADFSFLPFRAARIYAGEAVAAVASTAVYVASVPLVAIASRDIHAVAFALAAARFGALVVIHLSWRHARRRLGFASGRYGMKPATILPRCRDQIPFLLDSFLTAAINFLDTLLIGCMLGTRAVGIYQIPARIMQGGLLVVQIVNAIYVPVLARIRDTDEWKSASRRMIRELAAVGMVLGGGMPLVAPRLVEWAFGAAYGLDRMAWSGFGVALACRLCAAGYGIMLIVAGRPSSRALGQAMVLSIFCLGVVTLSGRFGLAGVSWSFAAAMATALTFYRHQTRRGRHGASPPPGGTGRGAA